MRKRTVIGAAMLAMAGLLLAGCGGVPQADLDAAEAATAAAEAATAALETELTAAEAALDAAKAERAPLREELTDLQWTIIELEALAADRAAAEAEAAGPSFWTYTNTEYGFTMEVPDEWTDGEDYGLYERLGNPVTYATPALGVYPPEEGAEPSEVEWPDSVSENENFGELLSETPGVLVDGTPVIILHWIGIDGATNYQMEADVNGTDILFGIDALDAWPVPGGLDMAVEILLSLVIDADLIE